MISIIYAECPQLDDECYLKPIINMLDTAPGTETNDICVKLILSVNSQRICESRQYYVDERFPYLFYTCTYDSSSAQAQVCINFCVSGISLSGDAVTCL